MKLFFVLLSLLASFSLNASQLQVSRLSDDIHAEDHLSYNFGTVWMNTRSFARFNVTNTGTTPLTFKDAIIYGADFGANHSCRNGLQAGQKCDFEIEYWPVFEGMSSGRFILSFVENDQIIVDLWGQSHRM